MSRYSPMSPWPPARLGSATDQRLPARPGAQFQAAPGSPGGMSNLDRCTWCGSPRSAHGINWSCPSGAELRGRQSVVLVIIAGIVALTGIGLLTASSPTATTMGSLGAAAMLAGLTVLVCYATVARRRR
jgi:hypothetical protein